MTAAWRHLDHVSGTSGRRQRITFDPFRRSLRRVGDQRHVCVRTGGSAEPQRPLSHVRNTFGDRRIRAGARLVVPAVELVGESRDRRVVREVGGRQCRSVTDMRERRWWQQRRGGWEIAAPAEPQPAVAPAYASRLPATGVVRNDSSVLRFLDTVRHYRYIRPPQRVPLTWRFHDQQNLTVGRSLAGAASLAGANRSRRVRIREQQRLQSRLHDLPSTRSRQSQHL